MPWNVGVLIIGSLYWDDEGCRDKWRERQLIAGSEASVRVPICYGRYAERRNAYTMVFEPDLLPESYGIAVVMRCRPISSGDGLIKEARQLWNAESKKCAYTEGRGISASWGTVALLISPNFLGDPDLTETEKADRARASVLWSKEFQQEWKKQKKTAPAAVDDRGFLKIEWPNSTLDNAPLSGFDILLATATQPTYSGRNYPTAKAISDAWKANKKELRYFTCNRRHKITTYQDVQIEKLLSETA